jgi:rhomboid protease GluP
MNLTLSLIAINIFIYLISAISSHSLIDMDLEVLVDMGALYTPLVVIKGEYFRVISAMFLHGGLTHIAMNMFSLYIVGRGVELYFSKVAYLSIYFASGIIGALVSLYIHPQSVGIGASGAIFGLFGAIFGFFLAHKKELASSSRGIFKEFGTILLINLILGLAIPSIDMSAHIAGMLIGVIGGYTLGKNQRYLPIFSLSMAILAITLGYILQSSYVKIYSY